MKVLVLGGRGFIGRQVVEAMITVGNDVLIGSRFANKTNTQIKQIRLHNMGCVEDWLPILAEVDAVVNCVGILRERTGETYQAIHQLAPTALAQACALTGKRLIHVSALGLSLTAKSRFIKSKYLGEQGILASKAEVAIVRPSLLDGEGGFGAKWFRMVAQWPIQFVMQAPAGRVAPLQVTDLAEAIAIIINKPKEELLPIYELGAIKALTIAQYLEALRAAYTTSKAIQITLPIWLVRCVSHLLDILHFSPLSFGHVELMQGSNVPNINQLPILLNRLPTAAGVNLITKSERQFVGMLKVKAK